MVELNDISAKYSADKHPDVISGKRTKDEILRLASPFVLCHCVGASPTSDAY